MFEKIKAKFLGLNQRSTELEWMDLKEGCYSAKEYGNCLLQLDRIGRFLGGDQATFSALGRLSQLPSSILDVGCGGGGFTMRLAAKYPGAEVVGIDINHEAIAFAQEQLKRERLLNGCSVLQNVRFQHASLGQISEEASFDVAIASLVCHHLADVELSVFLQQACRIANQSVILNDLHRHPMATGGFALIAPLFFPNRMIWHDGLLSIRRSFTRKDWARLLMGAGILESEYAIRWHWPFRWIVEIDAASRHFQ